MGVFIWLVFCVGVVFDCVVGIISCVGVVEYSG